MFALDPRYLLARTLTKLTHRHDYVIRRTDTPKTRFYVRTLWDYKWTGTLSKATVFRSLDEVCNEIMSTRVYYECSFTIEDAPPT